MTTADIERTDQLDDPDLDRADFDAYYEDGWIVPDREDTP